MTRTTLGVATLIACALLAMPAEASPTIRQIAEADLPSVVTITIHDKAGQIVALGSGFVVRDGLIATNDHVVAGAKGVTVYFSDGHSVESPGYAAADVTNDIAIIRADTGRALALPLAQSDDVHVGDAVVAIGSPIGLAGTVSSGIVSALRDDDYGKMIQMTAPISHGSSGGALIDADGEVIGVTSNVVEDGENLNFARPIEFVSGAMLKMTSATYAFSGLAPPPDPDAGPDDGGGSSGGSDGGGDQQAPPANPSGMVWVNTQTGVYHRPGSRYYGHTKQGTYMTEKDAIAKGYHLASHG